MSGLCRECGRYSDNSICSFCGTDLTIAGKTREISLLNERYEILDMVKSGGMGSVYKARDTRLGGFVAVKKLLSSNIKDREYAEMKFTEEGKLLSKLHHSGLPGVIDFFTDRDRDTEERSHYLVMTFIDGKDLETIIRERKGNIFPLDEAMDYFHQILNILSYLHTQDPPVIYRDMKPSNIMIQEGHIFLIDFGIARIFMEKQEGTVTGTPGYSPPEQYKGFADSRSDLYSLGAVMHYLLTGIDPQDETRPTFEFPSIREINPEVPEYVEKILMSMLEMSVDNRPESADEIMRTLHTQERLPVKTRTTGSSMKIFVPLIFALLLLFFCHKGINLKKSYNERFPSPSPGQVSTIVPAGSTFIMPEPTKNTSSKPFYAVISKYGYEGTDDEQLQWPRGMAFDSKGNVYIADSGNKCIKKLSRDWKFIKKWSTDGELVGGFSGIAIDPYDNIYITGPFLNCVQKFDSNGNFIIKWGTAGNGKGQFRFPIGIAVDRYKNIYVLEGNSSIYAPENKPRIHKFDYCGNFITSWGSDGTETGSFQEPESIAVDLSGFVYVLDKDRIQKFDSGGKFITSIGGYEIFGGRTIGIDNAGNIYIGDFYHMQKLDSAGNFITSWGSRGSGAGQFNEISDIIVDSSGCVYVVESRNHRIQKFAPLQR
ncbi:MAG: serine/threonine-protein kinase [Candidatus Eremiobacterota bacterium]